MSQFPLLLLVGCLICIGIWNAFKPDMILGCLGRIWDKRLPEMLQKPLYSCPPCMASIYGSALWILAGGDLTFWLPYVLALSGLNRIVSGKLL